MFFKITEANPANKPPIAIKNTLDSAKYPTILATPSKKGANFKPI